MNKETIIRIFKLRPYQQDICEQVNKSKDDVLIEAPTGAGKTVIAEQIVRDEISKGGKVLIVVPKLELMKQTEKTFSQLSPEVIHGKNDFTPESNVFISTIQTAHKRDLGFEPTMIIVDEVHHGFKGVMLKTLRKDFNGRLIGLSATPYDNEGKTLGGFDLHIKEYDQGYMIVNNYLVPPVPYILNNVNLKGIKKIKGDYSLAELDTRFNNIETITEVVKVTKPFINKRKQGLIFCINIKHAELMAETLRKEGISAEAIHSKLDKEKREQIMQDFRAGRIKVLTNPEMLTTGFDHPPVDFIVFARSTKSQNLYKQMVGRGLRLSEGKDNALILDCAGVIKSLGMPTNPIVPRQVNEREKSTIVCSECNSKKLYRKTKGAKSYWTCPTCGYEKEVKSKPAYSCKECKKAYGSDAKFVSTGGSIFLSCICGEQTLISKPTSTEELEAIFDDPLIAMIQNRVVKQYVSWLMERKGAAFIVSGPVQDQIKKLLKYIQENPAKLNNLNHHDLDKRNDWRIMFTPEEIASKKHEEYLEKFNSSETLDEAIFYVNKMLLTQNRSPVLPDIEKTLKKQMKDAESWAPNVEALTVQRLKNIYQWRQPIEDIVTFIPYIYNIYKQKHAS